MFGSFASSSRYPSDLQVWIARFSKSKTKADQLLIKTIEAFGDFAGLYTAYFEEIIVNGKFDKASTTEDRLRTRVLSVLNDYWAPVRRVAEQRMIPHYREILDEGTMEAERYLQALNLSDPGGLIYFDKAAVIRRFPYTNTPFIGVPYNITTEGAFAEGQSGSEEKFAYAKQDETLGFTEFAEKDWMAIPHELGHYVYWNQLANSDRLLEQHGEIRKGAAQVLSHSEPYQTLRSHEHKALTTTLLDWLEELYADVLGTRLGGAQFVESLQSIIERWAGNIDDLMENDGAHPVLYLRAFVREKALELNGGESPVDWPTLFQNRFGIQDELELEFEVVPVLDAATAASLDKEMLLAMLGVEPFPENLSVTGFVELPVTQVKTALLAIVSYLNEQISAVLASGIPVDIIDMSVVFDEMREQAEKEVERSQKPTYEILLQPQILEGGQQHAHNCWAHLTTHWMSTHNH